MSVVLRPGAPRSSLFRKARDWLESVLFIGIEAGEAALVTLQYIGSSAQPSSTGASDCGRGISAHRNALHLIQQHLMASAPLEDKEG